MRGRAGGECVLRNLLAPGSGIWDLELQMVLGDSRMSGIRILESAQLQKGRNGMRPIPTSGSGIGIGILEYHRLQNCVELNPNSMCMCEMNRMP